MKELVLVLAKSLVPNPDQVSVEQTVENGDVLLEIRVAPEDVGKVIGKQGRIIKAIRSVVKSAAIRQGVRAMVEVAE